MASAAAVPEWLQDRYAPKYPRWAKVVKSEHTDGDIVNGCHMPSLKVSSMSEGVAKVYSFRFDEPFSWAIFTINDATGELNIQSDWGNYQHRWNISSLGESYQKGDMPLTMFLARNNDAGYVTDKLHYGRQDRDQFSEQQTKDCIKQEIIQARIYGRSCDSEERDDNPWYLGEKTKTVLEKWFNYDVDCGYTSGDGLTKEEARILWDQLEHVNWDSTNGFMESLQCNNWGEMDELIKFMSDDWYEGYVRTEPTFGFTLLQYVLLPFFFEFLRREVVKVDAIRG